MRCFLVILSAVLLLVGAATAQTVDDLSIDQRKELTVFAIRGGLGILMGPNDVKDVPSGSDLETMIATGLNGNGLLCASIREIWALRLPGKYEVTCVAYRGGSGTKTYVIDALNGVAFQQ